jgi:sulfur-carrier protein adenylyltransferase/sulfurtransferase
MFTLQENPIDVGLLRTLYANRDAGALVSFEGMIRPDQGCDGPVNALFYHADPEQCLPEGEKIIREAMGQYAVRAICVQRIGKVRVGETAVWIGVWSGHRDEAYKASRYIIEEVKKRLLIWKKELYADGTGRWIQGSKEPVII